MFFLLLPLDEHDTSYFAESASIFSFSIKFTGSPEHMFGIILSEFPPGINYELFHICGKAYAFNNQGQ